MAFQASARFDSIEVDFRAGELRKHGVRVRLQIQPFTILSMLLERPGEVVTREELRRALWPEETFVEFDRGLNNAMNRLRDALGDSAAQWRFIETLPRRGYRFIAPVEKTNAAGTTPAQIPEVPEAKPETSEPLVEEVRAYLDALAKKTAELPPYYPAHLTTPLSSGLSGFDDIRQTVHVVEDRIGLEEWLKHEREAARAAGLAVEGLSYDPARSQPHKESVGHRRWSSPPATIRWDQFAACRFKRAIILGDPGFGKTWLLRYEARRLAEEGLENLREHIAALDNLMLPVLVRLSELNQSDSPVEHVLVTLTCGSHSDAFRSWVRNKITVGSCVEMLDAWDEVPVEVPQPGEPLRYQPGYRQRLGQRLETFVERFPRVRLLLTSRAVGYSYSPFREGTELELLAFDPSQTEAFVRAWFKGERRKQGVELLSLLRQNPQIRGLARIPLMLALICRAYQGGVLTFPTRRAVLYDVCLRGLMRGWQSEKQQREMSDGYVDAVLGLFQDVCYDLFVNDFEEFSESTLRRTMLPHLEQLKPWHELYGRSPTT
jgi:DNA-binding winged helix-turn-helix (wHTH) protein